MSCGAFLGDESSADPHAFDKISSDKLLRNLDTIQDVVAKLHPLVIQYELLKTEALTSAYQALAADRLDARKHTEHRAGSLFEPRLEIGTRGIRQPHIRNAAKPLETAKLGHANSEQRLIPRTERTDHSPGVDAMRPRIIDVVAIAARQRKDQK